MAQPPLYTRNENLVEYAAAHPTATYPPASVDAEFDDVRTSLNQAIQNLGLIQRDDGQISNSSVGTDQIDPTLLALFGEDVVWRGDWATLTAYAYGDVVEQTDTRYICLVAHTAGTFATDLAAGKWQALGQQLPIPASQVSATPAGNLVGTTAEAQIYELDAEKAALAGSASQTFSAADSSDDQHAVSRRQIQKNELLAVAGAGSGDAITATMVTGGVTALSDRMRVQIKAPGANTIAAPTLNLTLDATATGALTIYRGDSGSALAIGDIAGADHICEFEYRATGTRWLLMNPKAVPAPAAAGSDDGKVVAVVSGQLQLTSPAGVFTATRLPAGVLFMWPQVTPPDWALELNGATGLSRATYDDLFAALANPGTFTVTIASPAVFTRVGHKLKAGAKIRVTTSDALPTGLAINTDYYVIAAGLTADAFQVSATAFGSAVNTSGSQNGVHTSLDHSVLGPGDGSSTFSLPDDRARFYRAWDDGAAVDANRVFGSTQTDDNKSHTHVISYTDLSTAGGPGTSFKSNSSGTGASSAGVATSGGTEARPINRAYLPCIAF